MNTRAPRWYRGLKLAEQVLDTTDPGYMPQNVQLPRASTQLGMAVCFGMIMTACLSPLDSQAKSSMYPWLLVGTVMERTRVDGFTGLSPRRLHFYVEVNHLCAHAQKARPLPPTTKELILFQKEPELAHQSDMR
jgi:urease accessory protein UreF